MHKYKKGDLVFVAIGDFQKLARIAGPWPGLTYTLDFGDGKPPDGIYSEQFITLLVAASSDGAD